MGAVKKDGGQTTIYRERMVRIFLGAKGKSWSVPFL